MGLNVNYVWRVFYFVDSCFDHRRDCYRSKYGIPDATEEPCATDTTLLSQSLNPDASRSSSVQGIPDDTVEPCSKNTTLQSLSLNSEDGGSSSVQGSNQSSSCIQATRLVKQDSSLQDCTGVISEKTVDNKIELEKPTPNALSQNVVTKSTDSIRKKRGKRKQIRKKPCSRDTTLQTQGLNSEDGGSSSVQDMNQSSSCLQAARLVEQDSSLQDCSGVISEKTVDNKLELEKPTPNTLSQKVVSKSTDNIRKKRGKHKKISKIVLVSDQEISGSSLKNDSQQIVSELQNSKQGSSFSQETQPIEQDVSLQNCTCGSCLRTFYSQSQLEKHTLICASRQGASENRMDDLFYCNQCEFTYTTRNKLKKHKKIHNKILEADKPIPGSSLRKDNQPIGSELQNYNEASSVSREIQQIDQDKLLQNSTCLVCKKTFSSKADLKVQACVCFEEYRASENTTEGFVDIDQSLFHEVIRKINKQEKSQLEGYSIVLLEDNHISRPSVKNDTQRIRTDLQNGNPASVKQDKSIKNRTCLFCKKIFFNRIQVDKHTAICFSQMGTPENRMEELYYCDRCEFTTTTSEILRKHKTLHHTILVTDIQTLEYTFGNWLCIICNITFYNQRQFRLHTANCTSHQEIRENILTDLYYCDKCEITSITYIELLIHKQIHTEPVYDRQVSGSSIWNSLSSSWNNRSSLLNTNGGIIADILDNKVPEQYSLHDGNQTPFSLQPVRLYVLQKKNLSKKSVHLQDNNQPIGSGLQHGNHPIGSGLQDSIQAFSFSQATQPVEQDRVRCHICKRTFYSQSQLGKHTQICLSHNVTSIDEMEELFYCDQCDFMAITREILQNHETAHGSILVKDQHISGLSSSNDNQTTGSGLQNRNRPSYFSQATRFVKDLHLPNIICLLCKKIFYNESDNLSHVNNCISGLNTIDHMLNELYYCNKCKVTSITYIELLMHKRIHDGFVF